MLEAVSDARAIIYHTSLKTWKLLPKPAFTLLL